MLKDIHTTEIKKMFNQALYEGDLQKLTEISEALLEEISWLRSIKVANEKYIHELEKRK
jgi:hypothetical protein